ncbi:M20/M25/M40 family metallo-hydrolase [bacterium]|nr:M20/M25/M40 family metallo-hydrolase [bacterium]
MSSNTPHAARYDEKKCLDFLTKFIAFPSVATVPAHRDDCRRCAEWVREELAGQGFRSELLETAGQPVVYGEYTSPRAEAPRLLFYGHYDVQPEDPRVEWKSEPFAAEVRDGRIYGRGAQDNKGQVTYVLQALAALMEEHGELPVSVAIVIEGEEESGSGSLAAALPDWKERLRSDVLLVCDTGSRAKEICAITMGLRGVAALTVRLTGPRTDLHSGVHGGVCPNPATEMARLIATLHRSDGSIAVEGFLDGVPEPNSADLALANSVHFPPELYESMAGVPPIGGERCRTFADRRGFRPTIEVNGIHSGYGGEGMKTIIPKEALAKISTRTVAAQDPGEALRKIEAHLIAHAPDGLTLAVEDLEAGGGGLSVSAESPIIGKARTTLEQLGIGEVELMWEGASIPIVAQLARVAEAEPLLVGFGLEEDNIHAPNESFDLDQLRKGFLFVSAFVASFAES